MAPDLGVAASLESTLAACSLVPNLGEDPSLGSDLGVQSSLVPALDDSSLVPARDFHEEGPDVTGDDVSGDESSLVTQRLVFDCPDPSVL